MGAPPDTKDPACTGRVSIDHSSSIPPHRVLLGRPTHTDVTSEVCARLGAWMRCLVIVAALSAPGAWVTAASAQEEDDPFAGVEEMVVVGSGSPVPGV